MFPVSLRLFIHRQADRVPGIVSDNFEMTSTGVMTKGMDEGLPQLEAALDAEMMRSVLQRRLSGEERFRIEGCRILQVRYKPGRKCLVAWSLTISEVLTGRTDEQIVCAHILPEGESLSHFEKAAAGPLHQVRCGRPLEHLPELEMVIRLFPNDRKLRGLARIADAEQLRAVVVPELVARSAEPGLRLAGLSHKIIHYVAEHACTVRIEAELVSPDSGEVQTRIWYGKTRDSDEGAATWRNMLCLWESGARLNGRLLMAEPLLYQPEERTLWQAGLNGCTLADQNFSSREFLRLLARAAETVAALHQSAVPELSESGTPQRLVRLREAYQLLSQVRPATSEPVRLLLSRLEAEAAQQGARPLVTLHADLHLKNFFVTDDRVALIDLDNLRRGDPLQDIGSFIASLYFRGLIEEIPARITKLIAEEFVRAYRAAVPWSFTEAELDWHIAAALIEERACRCVTRLKAGRLEVIDELVALAGRIYGRL